MKKIFLICCLFLATLSGCKVETPVACATNYPVYYLISKIGGSYIETCNLSKNELIQRAQVSDTFLDDLNDADLLFYISGLEPYFSVYQDDFNKSSITKVDLAKASAIYKFARTTSMVVDTQEITVESPYYEGEEFKYIDTYDKDLAIWMDPNAMMSMAMTIRDTFVSTYPENAAVFEDNYSKLEVEFAQFDASFQNLKDEKRDIAFVTMTPNFGTWQKSYGFRVYPVILSRYGALPTASQLAAIKARIKNDGVKYIAHEENLPEDVEALYNELVAELGLTRINLNNISSISGDAIQNNKDYLTLMYENLAQLESLGN